MEVKSESALMMVCQCVVKNRLVDNAVEALLIDVGCLVACTVEKFSDSR